MTIDKNLDFKVRESERGYVLITAVWMLLLGASIVAVIVLKTLQASQEASFDRKLIDQRYALESAVETVAADILFNGPRSEFAQLPAKTNYTINGVDMRVQVTSESGKIDLNQADPALIERALRGLGVAALARQNFIGLITSQQKDDRVFQSLADALSVMKQVGMRFDDGLCPQRYFTVYSGLSRPKVGQMDAKLSRALGEANLPSNSRTPPGTALELRLTASSGLPLIAVIRTTGLIGESYGVLDWRREPSCDDDGR